VDYSPAPTERARLRPVNPLTVAVAVVLLSAGGAFGWQMKTRALSARPTPEAAAAALALERVDGDTMCGSGGRDDLRDDALRGDSGPLAERLADYLPQRSPLPGYVKVSSHAIDASSETEFVAGAVDGHVVSYRPEGEGGFDVYAYRFLTRRAAADAVADNVARRVCEFGAKPLAARGHTGMVVVEERRRGEWSTAWWITHSDVIVVRYGGWGDAQTSLANLAAIAGATALL
jgi:hypothetical protein